MKPLTQVAAFVALVFAVPWLVAPLLPQQPQSTWELILSYLPGVWAPTVIALVMMTLTGGRAGLARELAERFRVASGRTWLLASAATPALVTAAGLLIARAAGDGQSFIPASAFGTVVLNAVTTGAVGEELGVGVDAPVVVAPGGVVPEIFESSPASGSAVRFCEVRTIPAHMQARCKVVLFICILRDYS